jgi:DNA-binding SARP family transcriptional activator
MQPSSPSFKLDPRSFVLRTCYCRTRQPRVFDENSLWGFCVGCANIVGMSLRNPIFALSSTGQHTLAYEQYCAQTSTTPEDDRWAGACLLTLGQYERAKVLLSQAVRRGCGAARIQLAMAHGGLLQLERAESVLAQVETVTLEAFDQVLAFRAAGMLAVARGQRKLALAHFEHAWEVALIDEDSEPLRPSVAQQLAIQYHLSGRDARAETFFDLALPGLNDLKRGRLLATRALCRVYLGDFVGASSDLQVAASLMQDSRWRLIPHIEAALERAQGHTRAAIAAFLRVSGTATDDPETELFVELELTALYTELDLFDQAHGHLTRAKQLSGQPYQDAAIDLRAGALLARQSDPLALPALERAATAFTALGSDREAAWTALHLAETCLRLQLPERADTAIRQALTFRHALGPAVLNIELRTLPVLLEFLAGQPKHLGHVLFEDWRSRNHTQPFRLEVRFFGDAGIFVDGVPVRLRYKRSLEVLAHLILKPSGRMKELLTDLFADELPATARSYVHQVRYDLEKSAVGLRIDFDRVSRTYTLECDGPRFSADVLEFQETLKDSSEIGLLRALELYRGPFLAFSENDWVREQREHLIWSAIQAGLEVIENLQAKNEFEKGFALAGRLLELDPFNQVLAGSLIRVAKNLNSESARLSVSRLRQRFETEFAEVPPVFDQLDDLV